MPGGYIGVDVFFVISGFLITAILADEAASTGWVRIVGFYERRIRRILPALFLVLAVTALAAIAILPPFDLKLFGRSLVSTLNFTSNFHFWKTAGYFAAPAKTQPLLHTWSLAVEEQFYIVWPLLIALVVRSRLQWTLLILGTLSLAIAEVQLRLWPEAAFYLLPARVCEFIAGAAIALGLVPRSARSWLNEGLAAAGLAMVTIAALCFSNETLFPGLTSMLPALGTALVILTGPATAVARVLSWRPFVFVGLISYSLYLWHWPLLVLPAMHLGRELTAAETSLAVAAAFALATLSWAYIERPFRGRKLFSGTVFRLSRVIVVAGASLAAFLLFAGSIVWTDGFAFRANPAFNIAQAEVAKTNLLDFHADCIDLPNLADLTACRYGDGATKVAAWGDSHANHWGPALSEWAHAGHFSIQQLASGGCPPLIGIDVYRNKRVDPKCRTANEKALAAIEAMPHLEVVVLAARWSLYAQTTRAVAESSETSNIADEAGVDLTIETSRATLERRLDTTISYLESRGIKVLIAGQVPEYEYDPGKCVIRALWSARKPVCDQPLAVATGRLSAANEILRRVIAKHQNAVLFDPVPHLCDARVCRAVTTDGQSLYHDFDHLTRRGSADLAPDLRAAASRLNWTP